MSSRSSPGRRGKRKKSSVSPSPKKPTTTVAALFKQQLLRQQGQSRCSAEQDSDEETLTFVREEKKSVYFDKSELTKLDDEEELSGCSKEETACADREDSSKLKVVGDSKLQPAKRLSRRLSLRKAKSKEAQSESHNAGFVSVSDHGDEAGKDSVYKPKSGQSSVDITDVLNSDGDGISGALNKASDGQCIALADNADMVDGTGVGDKTVNHPLTCHSSSKGKLSLKRRQTSHKDSPSTSFSSKKSKSDSNDFETNLTKDTPAEENSRTEDKCAKTGSVFSIFKPSSEQVISPKSLNSPSSVTDSDAPVVGKSSKSLATSKTADGQKNTQSRLLRLRETKDTKKDVANLPTSSEASTEETEADTKERNEEDEGEDSKEERTVYRVPYYLENFLTIVKSVFADDYYVRLFNEADLCHVEEFNNLSEPSQKLYVRLFSRKLAWLSTAKIKYPEIADDLTPSLQELVDANLLSSGKELDDLEAMLGAMSAPNLRTLAKSYHVNPAGQHKGQIIQTLMAKSQQQSTVASLFGQKTGGVRAGMLKKARGLLGAVYRLREEGRAVFVRAMMLFSLVNTSGDDDSASGGQGQLFQMLLVNMGRVVYPTYTVNRKTPVFSCRQDLIRFEEALQLETELLGYTSTGNWKSAYSSFLTVKESYEKTIKDDAIIHRWDQQLPEFLRYYTAGSVLVRLLNQGIEILQRRKEHAGAVALTRQLLGQSVYNADLHGYWWDRLAINLDAHLKQPEQALQAIQDGLADPLVRVGHRLSLFLRAETICSKPKSPFSHRLKSFSHEPLVQLPKTFVEGRVLPHSLPGSRYQFITEGLGGGGGEGEEVTMCNVEQIVLDHYKVHGFPQGIHAEGSVVSSLFCLYFWEILFMEVEDAFHSPYQTCPLDLHTDAFYQRRQTAVHQRLAAIESSDEQALHSMLADTWEKQHGVMCTGINWDRFTSVGEVQGLVSCMGGKVLSGILRRYAHQPRHTRSGFPDLTLWNTTTKQLKICEVKGPGDRLSHKQTLWLDHLLKLGVDAEVCHVKPVGVKKLKPISKQPSDNE